MEKGIKKGTNRNRRKKKKYAVKAKGSKKYGKILINERERESKKKEGKLQDPESFLFMIFACSIRRNKPSVKSPVPFRLQ